MIEWPRRHGHFDPRYRRPSDLADRLGSKPRVFAHVDAVVDEVLLAIATWESEGGHTSAADELPEPLDWAAFSTLRFPVRRRHDLEALVAYAHYRAEVRVEGPQSSAVERDRGRAAYLVSL
jgi:hypothetical protein